jgi:hypothetical protein
LTLEYSTIDAARLARERLAASLHYHERSVDYFKKALADLDVYIERKEGITMGSDPEEDTRVPKTDDKQADQQQSETTQAEPTAEQTAAETEEVVTAS